MGHSQKKNIRRLSTNRAKPAGARAMQVPWQRIQGELTDRMFTLAEQPRSSDGGKFTQPCPDPT
jgi:hypothetical protein